MNIETDSTSLCYQLLKQQLKCCKQTLLHILRLDNAETSKLIFVCQSEEKQRGRFAIDTRELNIPLGEAPFFTSWLSRDFPKASIGYFNSRLSVEENRNSETAVDVLNQAFKKGVNNGTENI